MPRIVCTWRNGHTERYAHIQNAVHRVCCIWAVAVKRLTFIFVFKSWVAWKMEEKNRCFTTFLHQYQEDLPAFVFKFIKFPDILYIDRILCLLWWRSPYWSLQTKPGHLKYVLWILLSPPAWKVCKTSRI